jgi:hypothetical protein
MAARNVHEPLPHSHHEDTWSTVRRPPRQTVTVALLTTVEAVVTPSGEIQERCDGPAQHRRHRIELKREKIRRVKSAG